MKLADAFSLIRNGASIKQYDNATGTPITRIETISNRVVDRNKCGYADIFDVGKYQDYVLQDGDILMSHINSVQHLGKTALYNKIDGEVLIHGMNLLVLRPKKKILEPKYAYIALNSLKFLRQLPRITKKSVNQASFSVNDLKQTDIDVPSISKQKEIAHTVMQIDRMIANRQRALSVADELVKSRFVELFGDFNVEPSFPMETLDCIADIVSGITKGRKTKETDLREVPYMAVSNVKDGYIDWTTIKTIMATDKEIEQYRIQPNDILMTEGGDPDKVGRGALISEVPKDCIHQNHIFRVRLNEKVNPIYFEAYLQQPFTKRYFLKSAKQTTGIASINMTQLRNTPIIMPPIDLQNQFADFVARTDKSKIVIQKNIDMLQILKNKLMQDCFR